MANANAQCPFGPSFDFTDPDVLESGVPLEEFAYLRKTSPVWWNHQPDGTSGFHDGGFWVISRHADIKAISRDNETWSANENGTVMRLGENAPEDTVELTRPLLINQDPPSHTRLRKLVSRVFTPHALTDLREGLETAAQGIVQKAADKANGNFVEDVAMQLPLLAIANLIGIPEEDHDKIFRWTNGMMAGDDPDIGDPLNAHMEIVQYAYSLAESRRRYPTDDILTRLVQADEEGEFLNEAEFSLFFILLASAGNETTRNALTHGMNAFLEHPEQWALYKRERPVTAVDEVIRWATPVHCFQRTAKADAQIATVQIEKGQRVGLFYSSANYDESVFDRPFEFNITRDPNPHLAFGGTGAHYCIGSNLARMEVDIMLNAIADVLPDIAKLSEPKRVRSGWLNGVKELEVSYNRAGIGTST
jgi:cholest-4-en-3-one 26-monooxygenase